VALALVLAAMLLAAPIDYVGVYDGGQMEIAAGLELKADGHFRYGLAYGALDEEAEGLWTVEGGQILLTTDPAPVPARFTLLEQHVAPPGEIEIAVQGPDGKPLTVADIAILYDDGDPDIVQAGVEPRLLPLDPARPPRRIHLHFPIYDVTSDPFTIDPAKGYGFVFRFEPNDVAKADFRRTPLAIEGETLILPRFDRTLRFRRR
jgi:hypothetical protein